MYSGIQTYKFNKDVIADRGFSLNNPAWQSAGNFVSAATNIPLDRAVNKYNNLRGAANNNNEAWQRIAMALGWNSWDVEGEVDPEIEKIKKDLKKNKKKRNKGKKAKQSAYDMYNLNKSNKKKAKQTYFIIKN